MYKYILNFCCAQLCACLFFAQAIINPHGLEKSDKNPEYNDVYTFYKSMDANHATIRMATAGPTDTDDSLQVVYYSANGKFDISNWKADDKVIIFINNGIHPGEPDGIVASMQLLWDITADKISIPDNVVLAIIPVFNISGAKSLRTGTRANQNGPALTGFRGNAQNLDLNRDFIKMDAKETRSLVRLFRALDPDVLIDNHVSNGADYQHIMTLLSTQHNKLGGVMGAYLDKVFEPALYRDMKERGYDLVPYVNVWGSTPDRGWRQFSETPRFLSGYAALHHTYAFVPETHMLKPFEDRVKATYALMQTIIDYSSTNAKQLHNSREQQRYMIASTDILPIDWTIDTTKHTMIEYKGYKAGMKKSAVSGQEVMYYDTNRPFMATIPFYNHYAVSKTVTVPKAYIIPQGWHKVIRRLKDNGVVLKKLEKDTALNLTVSIISDYKTTPSPYEGHYLHSRIKSTSISKQMNLAKGDYIITTSQPAKRYIVESLEPEAPDGFFAWGFFDGILQQKEGFSDYAFENLAADILKNDAHLAALLAKDADAQLEFVFQNCSYHEPEHMRYPVYRLD
jgi:hypothetical protein